jgi:hypothetical protein
MCCCVRLNWVQIVFKKVRVDSIGLGAIQVVRDEDTTANGKDIGVEVVVDQVELLGRCEGPSSSVDFAAELGCCWIIFVFPELQLNFKKGKT